MKQITQYFILIIPILIDSCSPVTIVKPLEKKQKVVSAHLGGPMITFTGIPMPIPFSSLGLHYGINNRLTVGTNLGITSLAFGVFQLDPGIVYGIRNPKEIGQLGISAFAKTHFMIDTWESNFRWYPELGGQVYKEWGKNLFYVGGSGWFETRYPSQKRAAGNIWVPMAHFGYIRQKPKWNLTLEAKWIAPNISHENIVVDYIGISTQGALGIYFGASRKF